MKRLIAVHINSLKDFLSDPLNLRLWTAHRTIFRSGDKYFELRAPNNSLQEVEIRVRYASLDETSGIATFVWNPGNTVSFRLSVEGQNSVSMELMMPEDMPEATKKKIYHIINIELDVLKVLLESGSDEGITAYHRHEIQKYHLSLYANITKSPDMNPFHDLPPFDGTFEHDPEKLEKFRTDFGKIIKTNPIGVLNPASAEDVVKIVRYCLNHNLKIIPRGMSHSAFGQCQCDGGIVVNMPAFNDILNESINEDCWIDVAGGILWNKLIKYTGEKGLGPVVTTDWQFLTVGGTISTGGVGFMSYKHGIQADHILEMDVVTGTGELVTCSPTLNPELYNAVRGGLGQFGIATRVRVPLAPLPDQLNIFQLFCTSAEHFHAGIEQARNSLYFDCIHAFVIPNDKESIAQKLGSAAETHEAFITALTRQPVKWIFFTELVKYNSTDNWEGIHKELAPFSGFEGTIFESKDNFYSYITKEPPLIVTEKEKGKTSHPELTLAHPASRFVEFMHYFLRDLKKEDMAEGPILIIPVGGHLLRTPLFKSPVEDRQYFIGILRNASPDTKERIDELMAKNIDCYLYSVTLGGNRYPCDSINLPDHSSSWSKHYGPELWKLATNAKNRFDPQHVFVSNLNIFGSNNEPSAQQNQSA